MAMLLCRWLTGDSQGINMQRVCLEGAMEDKRDWLKPVVEKTFLWFRGISAHGCLKVSCDPVWP